MPFAAHEQYILELINRGRLDPLAEAARFGIDLNQGLSAGTISGEAKQVLSPNALLSTAATSHSLWMLQTNTFSHTGQGGSSARERIEAGGYTLTGGWSYGENLAYGGSTGGININEQAEVRYNNLFLSAGHRTNTMGERFREVGIGHEEGAYNQYNASMLTQKFGSRDSDLFVTGVAYTDSNNNDFYTIGEGRGDITIIANGRSDRTEAAGGYGIGIEADSTTDVDIRQNGASLATVILDVGDQNAKLDIIRSGNQWELASSADLDLETGIGRAVLLGTESLDLIGHGGNNHLQGNKANNEINGMRGNDMLFGHNGWDTLIDGQGSDTLFGGHGNDLFVLEADGQTDIIWDWNWGRGDDRIDIRGWAGVAGLSDLTITATGNGARIMSESETLIVINGEGGSLSAADFNNSDFLFGTLPSQAAAPEPLATPDIPDLAANPTTGQSVIAGSATSNILEGSSGNDRIQGFAGNDILGGSSGADTLYGGSGNDRYILNSAGDRIGGEVGYSDGGGIDTVEAWVDYVLPRNLEILRLQGSADLDGAGNFAPDVLVGNAGDNLLDGGGGNDRIVSKDGDDVLVGRAGADLLEGNAGADVFILTAASDSRAGAANRDFINGFEHGADKIDLTHVDANTLRGGHQEFRFIGDARFSADGAVSAGELRYFTFNNGNYNIVEADINGDGRADIQMFVNQTNFMTGTDFIL